MAGHTALPETERRLLGTDMPTWGTYEAGLQRIPVDQELSLSDWDRVTDLGVLQIG